MGALMVELTRPPDEKSPVVGVKYWQKSGLTLIGDFLLEKSGKNRQGCRENKLVTVIIRERNNCKTFVTSEMSNLNSLPVCLSACLPVCLSVCLSVCLPVCLSVSLSA